MNASSQRLIRASLCLILIATLPAACAWAQAICGNGVTEPGEQCDVADTASGSDECDTCAEDCTVTAECGAGACSDNADNDNDGLKDEADPSCASLYRFRSLAVTALDPAAIALRLGSASRIDSASSQAGSVCARRILARSMATVGGSMIAVDEARFPHLESSAIGRHFVTASGQSPRIPWAPVWVGSPLGSCTVAASPCLSDLDCLLPTDTCDGRLKLNAIHPDVDLLGSGIGAAELSECVEASEQAITDTMLSQFGNPDSPELSVKAGNQTTLTVGAGLTFLSYKALHLGVGGVLTLRGPSAANVVIRVDKRCSILPAAQIVLEGGLTPGNLLWIVNGRGSVRVGHSALFQGFLWAPGRKLFVDAGAQLRGALVAKEVRLDAHTQVEHHPLTFVLPTQLEMSAVVAPALPVAPGPLEYSLSIANVGPGQAGVVNLNLQLDPQSQFVGVTTSQGSCLHDGSNQGGLLRCYLGSISDQDFAPANQVAVVVQLNIAPGASTLLATATLNHQVSLLGEQTLPIQSIIP